MRKYLSLAGIFFLALFYFLTTAYAGEAPDFQLLDLNDQKVSLSDYKHKQAVVLFFWTTWCPYCREELRILNAEQQDLAKDAITLLAINVGESKHKVENFVKGRNLRFRVLLDETGRVTEIYDLLGVPSYIVVNSSGQIVFRGSHFPKEMLKELKGK
ncbi:MAG: TlpA disulfide reductase family protein [Candidatus Omnitrophica bacterium]|nr:TlpA disulfide reductase family protein [Candidatus Omnitrophota bacterium]